MQPNHNVISKIRNLLKRAEVNSGATLHEQLTCAEIAQRLMDQYRITYEVVMNETGGGREAIIDYIKEYKCAFTAIINPSEWIQGLYNVVAKANNCEVYITSCEQEEHKFQAFSIVGRPTDISVVEDLCLWLLINIVQISGAEVIDPSYISDFCMGAVRKLKEKFDALKVQKKEVPGITEEQMRNALVRLDESRKEVKDFFDRNGGSERWESRGNKSSSNISAFSMGYNAAEQISINQSKLLETK